MKKSPAGQAMPDEVVKMTAADFAPRNDTAIYWLGNGGAHINARGTNIMIDPLLKGFDMPVLFEAPIAPADVPHLDGVLITHIDNDHFSRPTLHDLKDVDQFHATEYVASEMAADGIPGIGHEIGDTFETGNCAITLTPAKHNWQSEQKKPKYTYRTWEEKEYCGYWVETPDGTIWMPGDSRLLESHLHMPDPDVILFDFSDNPWHITLDGAVKLANAYPDAELVLIHWGTVDAPDQSPFNGNPEDLMERVVNPERINVLNPGEPLILQSEMI